MTTITWPSPSDLTEVSESQREAYAKMTSRGPLAILTGGAGTGKTTTVASVVRAIQRQHPRAAIALAAPTGKAGVRATQVMAEKGIDLKATTSHRMLGVSSNGHDGDGWGFVYNHGNKLPHDVVILDEQSMLDTNMGYSIFQAIRPSSLVLMVGDIGQLLPVSHGAPMRDMLRAGVPHGELTEIWRNAGDIARAADEMRRNGAFSPSEGRNLTKGENWWHIPTKSNVQTQHVIKQLFSSPMNGFDILRDVQLITALNGKTDVARDALNRALHPILNPNARGKKPEGFGFFNGDKVICKKNSFFEVPDPTPEDYIERYGRPRDSKTPPPKHFVANGETGFIEEAKKGACVVEFEVPQRRVRLAGAELKEIELAYAITTHKSQGSQWPVVVFIIDESPSWRFVASRELIYTGITRGQTLTITIGQAGIAREACRKVRLNERKTFLRELLAT